MAPARLSKEFCNEPPPLPPLVAPSRPSPVRPDAAGGGELSLGNIQVKVVSEQTSEQVENERKIREYDRDLRIIQGLLKEMTANLLRVVRGAGRPYLVGRHAYDFTAAMQEFFEKHRQYPYPEQIRSAICQWMDVDDWKDEKNKESLSKRIAEEQIMQGALQIVASKLLGQSLQQSAGSLEMYNGITNLHDAMTQLYGPIGPNGYRG